MTKIGNYLKLCITLLFFQGFSVNVFSQDVTLTARLSETNLISGERVTLELSISGQNLRSINRPDIPPVDGLRWMSGSTSSSSNYSYINGKPSVSYTYGYLFIAQSPGSYTFPALTISVNGKNYTTKPISFQILPTKALDSGNEKTSPDIYLRLEPNTKNPVVGEQVIASMVLYFKNGVDVSSYQASPGWKAVGFWKEELENPQRAQTSSVIINGVRYQRAVLMQYALFPTKTGELTLSPFEVTVKLTRRNQKRDIFDTFSMRFGQEQLDLQTLPVTLDVKPLPKPGDALFIGAVGNFSIKREINPKNALVGESIEITTTVSGIGNVPLVTKPEYDFPETLEQYNPEEDTQLQRNNKQISGTKTFTDIVIARNEGDFTIPAVTVACFNPGKNTFETTSLPAVTLHAKRDPRAANSGITELRLNIQPVTGLANWMPVNNRKLYTSASVWLLLISPLALGIIGYLFKNYNDKMTGNSAFARSQKAKEKAFAILDSVQGEQDIKRGYANIRKGLTGFISDKLNLAMAGIPTRQIVDILTEKTDSEIAMETKKLLDKCETIAYAPNATVESMETDVANTRELIKKIGKAL